MSKQTHQQWISKVRQFNAWLDDMAAKLKAAKQGKKDDGGFEQFKKAMGL